MRALLLLCALLPLGCKSDPRPGAYLCASDGACPGALRCLCGQCVNGEAEAACAFDVESVVSGPLHEYAPFDVKVTARTASGAIATGFAGRAQLSFELPDGSRWSAVTPSEVTLAGGAASVRVSLNRETIPPQSPWLVAKSEAASGHGAQLDVLAAPFTKDPAPVVAPIGAPPGNAPAFGWVEQAISDPSVVLTPAGLRMYYSAVTASEIAIGVTGLSSGCATAAGPCVPDASLPPRRVLAAAAGTFYPTAVGKPSALVVGADVHLAFQAIDAGLRTIGLAKASDGLAFAVLNNNQPVLAGSACSGYCSGNLLEPNLMSPRAGELQLYFSASPQAPDLGELPATIVGRATAIDGLAFVPAPAPLLNGEVGGETALFATRVLWDRGVYKMWYAFTRDAATGCATTVSVGYATSLDGLYWIRSPSNPVLKAGGVAWEGARDAIQVGAVVPLDGVDPANGLALYYHAFPAHPVLGACFANGIGRATAVPR